MIRYATMTTPLGEMIAASYEEKLCLLEFTDRKHMERQLTTLEKYYGREKAEESDDLLHETRSQLEIYFSGQLREFSIPLIYRGTDFEERVWNELLNIPYGRTVTYGVQAERLGSPRSVRAVAGANSRNRLAIVIPCHRVIGKKGKLTGYAGGVDRKARLLALEGAEGFTLSDC